MVSRRLTCELKALSYAQQPGLGLRGDLALLTINKRQRLNPVTVGEHVIMGVGHSTEPALDYINCVLGTLNLTPLVILATITVFRSHSPSTSLDFTNTAFMG